MDHLTQRPVVFPVAFRQPGIHHNHGTPPPHHTHLLLLIWQKYTVWSWPISTHHSPHNTHMVSTTKPSFRCMIHANQLTPPWLVQTKYRAAIRHLLYCMQTRGQSLKVRHILSHMEHTPTDDDDLSILRDRLAEADTIATIAGGGYTQVPLVTPIPHWTTSLF
jgi:hypothetical protein